MDETKDYTNIQAAKQRLVKELENVDSNIKEWNAVIARIFDDPVVMTVTQPKKQLLTAFQQHLSRAQKLRDNLLLYKYLYDNIGCN